MLFNSLTFLIFALGFFSLWPLMARKNLSRWVFLTTASFVFYGWWDWRFLFLILFSGLVDYVAGLGMSRYPGQKRFLLILSLIANLGSLAVFKYSGWLARAIEQLAGFGGLELQLEQQIPAFALILPVGISFYTFQSMSYTLDIYRGRLKPTRNLFHFFAYLSLFPQLVAGPIIRARDLLDQLQTHTPPTAQRRWHGFRLIVTGLFQKMVLADHLGVVVNHAFKDLSHNPSTLFSWVVMVSFAFQIYFDFAGYSQIARGLAKWMGLQFKMNFNHPYLSCSLREFWTRWHISLSQWFRDYLYIPIGGNRHGPARAVFHMWVVMLVSGIWHGTNATYLMWGACHALFLMIERFCWSWYKKVPALLRHGMVFVQILIAWVFFRAETMEQAWTLLFQMFTLTPGALNSDSFYNAYFFLCLSVMFEGLYAAGRTFRSVRNVLRNPWVEAVEVGLFLAACVYFRGPEQAFIYFQF